MKKYIFLFLSIFLLFAACEKNEEPYIRFTTTEVIVDDVGGEATIGFETNSSWIASSSQPWCRVSPQRGGQSSRSTTVTLSANDGYEARTCLLSIVAGGVTQSITITQLQKDAVILTNKSYELSSSSHTLEVGVKTNVELEVIIADDAKGWISTTATRALGDKTVTLYIADNEASGDARRAEVYIRDKDSDLQDVLTIVQKGVSVIADDAELVEWDGNRFQHLNVEGDFVFRMDDLDNDDVYFVFSNVHEWQKVGLPYLVDDRGVMSRGAKPARSFDLADASFIVSGMPAVTEFNNNPPKPLGIGLEGAKDEQGIATRAANLGVGTVDYLNDADDKPIQSTVRKVVSANGANLYVWVANDCWHDGGTKSYTVTQPMVDALADKFLASGDGNDIYEWVRNATGEHWGPTTQNYYIAETDDMHIWLMDIDGDDKTTGTITAGYFYARDNYLKSAIAKSNEKLLFTVDAVLFAKPDRGAWNLTHFWPTQIISTLAHEFTHMVYFYQHEVLRGLKSNTAINEMCAQCVEDLVANKILTDGPRGVPYAAASAGTDRNSSGRLPLFNEYNDYTLLDWSGNEDETLTNYSKTYALGAYLMRNYGGANFIRELIQNDYTGAASIVQAVNANGGGVASYGDVLQRFGVASMLSDKMDMDTGYRFNRGDVWSESTVGGIRYDLGSINLYNYLPAPYIYDELPNSQHAGSNLFYNGGSGLSGQKEWYFKGMNEKTQVSVVVR